MFLTQKKEFNKVYIPGYTGHVPHKKNLPPAVFVVDSDLGGIKYTKNDSQVIGGRHPGACSNLGTHLDLF